MRRPFGRTLIAVGDNPEAAAFAGTSVWWLKTRAFMLSSLSATVAGILLVGYAGVHPSVGQGYEFSAITAVVLGGVVLGGGRGWVLSAAAGAFALELLFTLLTFLDVASTWRDTVQGLIIILAVAAVGPRVDARASPARPRRATHLEAPQPRWTPLPRHHPGRAPTQENTDAPKVHPRARSRPPRRSCWRSSPPAARRPSPTAGDDPTDTATSEATAEETEDSASETEWFVQADFDEQDEQRGGDVRGRPRGAVAAVHRRRDDRHLGVQVRRRQEGLLRQRLDHQPVAADRLDHHEPAARRCSRTKASSPRWRPATPRTTTTPRSPTSTTSSPRATATPSSSRPTRRRR